MTSDRKKVVGSIGSRSAEFIRARGHEVTAQQGRIDIRKSSFVPRIVHNPVTDNWIEQQFCNKLNMGGQQEESFS